MALAVCGTLNTNTKFSLLHSFLVEKLKVDKIEFIYKMFTWKKSMKLLNWYTLCLQEIIYKNNMVENMATSV